MRLPFGHTAQFAIIGVNMAIKACNQKHSPSVARLTGGRVADLRRNSRGWARARTSCPADDRGRNRELTLPLPPNRTGGFPASGSPVSGPLFEHWLLWPGLRLRRLTRVPRNRHLASGDDPVHSPDPDVCDVGANITQAPARPSVQALKDVLNAVLEVVEPAPQRPIGFLDDLFHRATSRALRFLPDGFFELFQAQDS